MIPCKRKTGNGTDGRNSFHLVLHVLRYTGGKAECITDAGGWDVSRAVHPLIPGMQCGTQCHELCCLPSMHPAPLASEIQQDPARSSGMLRVICI